MSMKTKGRRENLVGAPLVGALGWLGGHKGRPYVVSRLQQNRGDKARMSMKTKDCLLKLRDEP